MAAPGGDAPTAGRLGGEQFGLLPLGLGHRTNHRFNFLELLLTLFEHAVVNLVHAGDQLHQTTQGTHALDQAHLLQEVGKIKGSLLQFLLHAGHVGQLHLLLGFLNQGQHIAHAQDAARHPFRVEGLQGFHLFAGTNEFDWGPAHLADRESGPAPGVAIQFGEDSSCDAHLLVESSGQLGGLLADHRIHDQQDFIRLHRFADTNHLFHHRLIDLEASGRVDQHRVEAPIPPLLDPSGGDLLRAGTVAQTEDLHADLAAQGLQLVDGRWPIDIGRHHQGTTAFFLEMETQFGGSGGFTGPLQSRHQHHGRLARLPGRGEGRIFAAHGLHQLLMYDLDELLVGTDAPHNFGADGFAAHVVDKILDHRQAHIRLQEGSSHLFQGAVHIGFGDAGLALEVPDRGFETLGKFVEHRGLGSGGRLGGDKPPCLAIAAKHIDVAQGGGRGAFYHLVVSAKATIAVVHFRQQGDAARRLTLDAYAFHFDINLLALAPCGIAFLFGGEACDCIGPGKALQVRWHGFAAQNRAFRGQPLV